MYNIYRKVCELSPQSLKKACSRVFLEASSSIAQTARELLESSTISTEELAVARLDGVLEVLLRFKPVTTAYSPRFCHEGNVDKKV